MSATADAQRALLRDVVAFSALPAAWVGQSPSEIAQALAEALQRTLYPDAVAVVLRAEHGFVEARAGHGPLLDADVVAVRRGEPVASQTVHAGVGPLGRQGAILVRAASVPPDRMLLLRLAANLADTALRESSLLQQATSTRAQFLRLEKLSALGQLLSGVAHELRTPLTYANNNIYLARSRVARLKDRAPVEADELDAMLDEVLAAHERILSTVSTLRRLASPRASQRVAFQLAEAVAEATRLFALTHTGTAVVTRRTDGDGIVLADPVEIQQVVLNLLQNAAEAAPSGVRIVVATHATAQGAHLIVEDDGPGIPAEIRDHIFDPFFTTKSDGMGLGLSIVRRILESHGGAIELGASALGGARVDVSFPLASGPEDAPGRPPVKFKGPTERVDDTRRPPA